jgi:O-antigen ligase
MAPAEIAANRHIYLDAFGVVGGRESLGALFGERFGVIRVTTIFSHPILHGLFCAPLVAVVWYTETSVFARLWKTAVVIGATAVSLSSAPLLVMILQFVMIAVEYATRQIKHRAKIIGAAVLSMLAFVHVTASRGIFAVVVILVLNPATAYYRREIWNSGMIDVRRSPIFGIVVENWTRPAWMVSGSIDNFWLFQMLRGGVPSVAFLLLAIVLIYWRVFRLADAAIPDVLRRQRRAWAYALAALLIGAVTVHLYGKAQPYFTFLIAIGAALVRLLDAAPEQAREAPAAAQSGRQVVIGADSGPPRPSPAARDATPADARPIKPSPPRRRTWM